jgi:hypothetical protein
VLALAAALVLAVTPGQAAVVRVPVANVWEAPNAGHLPLDPHVWPTRAVSYAQRIALVGTMPTQVLYGESVRVLERRGLRLRVRRAAGGRAATDKAVRQAWNR